MAPTVSSRLRSFLQRGVVQHLIPVSLLLITCFGCLLLLFYSTTRDQDRNAEMREVQSLQRTIETAQQNIVRDLQDYAKWDDAVRHISRSFQPEWMADNVTAFLGETQGYQVFTLDPRNTTIYAFADGKVEQRDSFLQLGGGFEKGVRDLRNIPIPQAPIVSGFTRQGNRTFIFAAATVIPLTNKVRLPKGAPYVLAIARPIGSDLLQGLERQEGLKDVDLSLAGPRLNGLSLPLRSRSGEVLSWINWEPAQPGTALRREIFPAFIVVACVALLLAGLIVFRGDRTLQALRRSEARAHHLANHDALTELPNRRALKAAIRKGVDQGEELFLLFMDLDGFKEANDVYGHAVGDALLIQAARRISRAAEGALVFRAGGDEFAVLATDTDLPGTESASQRILDAFRAPFSVGGYKMTVGISVGCASFKPTDVPDDDELMRRADAAMYVAKAEGKNRSHTYSDAMDADHRLRVSMESDLRTAIATGEIRILFQPVVDAATGWIVGVEALSRWSHPLHGEVLPDVFIPLAELSGAIGDLGRHVLTQSCIEGRDLGLDVAVNISPAQFWDRNLVAEVEYILQSTGFAPERLELEITESYLLRRPDAAARIIDDLRALGVRIALDDFGTGFASIGYLRRLRFDRLKIDKSFVGPLATDQQAASILFAIVALARSMELEITAEGVEEEEQALITRMAGCSRLQGWLFGKAMTAAEITQIVSAQRAAGGDILKFRPQALSNASGVALSAESAQPRLAAGGL
jgi:diguanylate cyclase (GGDEF)-like protein